MPHGWKPPRGGARARAATPRLGLGSALVGPLAHGQAGGANGARCRLVSRESEGHMLQAHEPWGWSLQQGQPILPWFAQNRLSAFMVPHGSLTGTRITRAAALPLALSAPHSMEKAAAPSPGLVPSRLHSNPGQRSTRGLEPRPHAGWVAVVGPGSAPSPGPTTL